jgi:hypothetical protein
MTGSATPPPSDDEVERRLAALKAGADPGSFGAAAGPAPADEPPLVFGDVIDGAGRTWTPSGGAAGGTGAAGGGPGPGVPPPGPGVRVVGWGLGQAEAGRLGLWIGLGLVAFGGYLVLAELFPGISFLGSLALAVLGGVLVAWHVSGRAGSWALYGGAIVAGFGVARLVAEVAGLPSSGWGTLGAGLGLLAIALRRALRREGIGWQAWVGGALAVFGGWGVLGATIPGFPTLGDLIVPLVLVVVGVAVLRRGFRPPAQP